MHILSSEPSIHQDFMTPVGEAVSLYMYIQYTQRVW